MNCYRCATPIPENSRFCLSCGALMPDATLQTQTADELDEAGARELELLIRAETAGEYESLREIGRGAMGVVYLAREIALARDVAMKVLPPHLTFGKGAIGRFRREARTAAALEHPNIIPVYRIAPGGRVFWYTMKYLEGRSLAEVLEERKTLPLAAAITILERIADALDYAHTRHVIHRDVKPSNVMLDPRGHILVMDFGIAKEAASGTLARSDAIIGTPYYMSPEQCKGGTLTGASDQYSMGVMAYQMLSGRVPLGYRVRPRAGGAEAGFHGQTSGRLVCAASRERCACTRRAPPYQSRLEGRAVRARGCGSLRRRVPVERADADARHGGASARAGHRPDGASTPAGCAAAHRGRDRKSVV